MNAPFCTSNQKQLRLMHFGPVSWLLLRISCAQQMSVMLHLLKPFPLSVSGPAWCSNRSRWLWTVNNQMLSKLLVSGLRYYCFRIIWLQPKWGKGVEGGSPPGLATRNKHWKELEIWYRKFWELIKGRSSRKPGANQQTEPGFLSLQDRALRAVLSFFLGESCVHEAFRERSFLRGRGVPFLLYL